MANPVFKELNISVVVNAVALRTLKDAELATTMAAIYQSGKPVVLTSDIADFSNATRIKKHIDAGTIKPEQLEYYMARALTAEDQAVITNYFNARKDLNALLNLVEVVYPFAEIPRGRDIEHIVVTANKLTRENNAISIDDFKKIWVRAYKFWSGDSTVRPRTFNVQQIGGYGREVNIKKTELSIGCTTIPRWEVEQLAVRLELPFSE